MIPLYTALSVFLLWATDVSQSVLITQWPHYISSLPDGRAKMHCYQNDTEYEYVYWYKHQKGKSLQFMGSVVAGLANFEGIYQSGFEAAIVTKKHSTLTITRVGREDGAAYLCAASQGSFSEVYFGPGTKLTVLENGISVQEPKVELLQPSPNECQNQKSNVRKKTLVCLATGFYPDHVDVSWEVNGVKVSDGVATDSAALRDGDHYKISSRLRVESKLWFTPTTTFKCIVGFYNGEDTVYVNATLNGVKGSGGLNRENYLKITQTAKLAYSITIIKSVLYGAFVVFAVWKLQGSVWKHN